MLHCISGQRRSLVVALLLATWAVGANRPASAQAPAAASSREIRSYAVEPERLQNLLEVFRQLYAQDQGTTITSDAKGGALVVAAAPEVHLQVEAFLKRSGYLRAGAAPQTQVAPVRTATPVDNARHQVTRSLGNGQIEVEVKLNQADWRQLEARTAQLIGERPPIALTAEGAIATLTLPTNGDKKIAMQIYRRDNVVLIRGEEAGVKAWTQVVRAIDAPPRNDQFRTDLVSFRTAKREDVAEALAPLSEAEGASVKKEVFEALKKVAGKQQLRWSGDMAAMIFQPGEQQDGDDAQPIQPADDGQDPPPVDQPIVQDEVTLGPDDDAGLIGPVQIEFLEGLDVIVVKGHRRDVERITRIINDIERLSAETQPVIEVRELLHANSEAVAATIQQLYEDLLQTRYGQVSITPLGRPNAILLIGRDQSVQGVLELIDKLDQPTSPERMLRVFQLRYISSADAQTRVTEFYADPVNLNPRVRSTADYRSNALIVQASPRDMAEVEYLIRQIDVPAAESTLELKVFELRNSLAEDLAAVLQAAISGTPAAGTQQQGNAAAAQVRAAMLSFMTLDSREGQLLKSGILTEAQITADTRSNALVVRAPRESMDLIGALIQRLDSQPSAESQIKVFTIVNGDATQLATMLETLFGVGAQGNNQGQLPFSVGAGGDGSLIPIRFSVDARTNSIIASGSAAELAIVEAILLRLDQDDVQQRQMLVVRLKNSNAELVAASLTELLQTESQLQQIDPTLTSSFQQVAREVIVVPEAFSNSLIITATPRYFKEIVKIVEELDARPPMVSIQVLIADVKLGKIEELGFEFGLQDSLLFDRSTVSSGTLDPGFNFNNNGLGNASTAASLATAKAVGTQGLSDLGLGRTNSSLGYGGFVFSAASESVNVLIRALQQDDRMEVLARPHVMTMDNQPAFIQVGQRVPYITSTQVTNQGTVNSITLQNTGVILNVVPRISPDGMVVMYVQAERSEVGNEADGIPISINQNGDVIRAPRIDTQTAQTTVSARSGQTIVLGGLIQKRTTVISRRVPILGDIPVVGTLFRYDSFDGDRSELMIVLTPTVVDSDQDVERVREQEMSRMSWCLADVAQIYGTSALAGVDHSIPEGEILEIRPDQNPTGQIPMGIPGSEMIPPPTIQQQSFPPMSSQPVDIPAMGSGVMPQPQMTVPVYVEPIDPMTAQPQLQPASLQQANFGVAPAAYNGAAYPQDPRPVRLPAVPR